MSLKNIESDLKSNVPVVLNLVFFFLYFNEYCHTSRKEKFIRLPSHVQPPTCHIFDHVMLGPHCM